jgi:hypothetical protein
MIEKTLKTKAGKIQVRIPTVIGEITLGQMMAMQERRFPDELDTISILSGIPKEELPHGINFGELQVVCNYMHSLSQQVIYLYNGDIIAQKVVFMLDGHKVAVNVVRNLSIEPAGAFIAARNIIADEINEHIHLYGEDDWKAHFQPSLASCCHLLAHYFFCRATGEPYDEEKATEFCKEVKKLRVTEALPIARYFFSAYPDLLQQRTGFLNQLRHYWRLKTVNRRLEKINS